jgi:hypothetical protein
LTCIAREDDDVAAGGTPDVDLTEGANAMVAADNSFGDFTIFSSSSSHGGEVEPDSALFSDYQVEQIVVVDKCVFTKVQRNEDKCTACGWTWRSWYKEGSKGCVEE